MSWLEKINTDFTITTGGKKTFRPQWMNAVKSKEYNVSEFEFPNVAGTLVIRRKPKGARYELELYFQGENHLDESKSFEEAADDSRPWTVEHPFYGTITVQPTALNFDNTALNVTKITGTVVETIAEDYPKSTVNPTDKIIKDAADLNVVIAEQFAVNTKPDVKNINTLKDINNKLFKEGQKIVTLAENFEEYFDLFNKADAAAVNAIQDPLTAMRTLTSVINAPAFFSVSVKARIDNFLTQFRLLGQPLATLLRPSDKRTYECAGGSLISAMAAATVSNYKYENRNAVLNAAGALSDTYSEYLANLDAIQTENGGMTDSYMPDAGALSALSGLVNYAVSNLFDISLNAKQERSLLCEEDTNIILLAHRLYPLQPDDSTIDTLIDTNEIGINELLLIEKGRKIIYYV